MATQVAGDMYEGITGQLFEIGRQLRQNGGYPFNPEQLKSHLQAAIEGRFAGETIINNGIFKTVVMEVDRTRSFRESLNATGRTLYTTDAIVNGAPRCEEGEIELVFFKPDNSAYKNGLLSCVDLEREYEKRGLVADLQALADFIAENLAFADETPVGCQWCDKHGDFCDATFDRWNGKRYVSVCRYVFDWRNYWSFAGVRKKSSASVV